MVDQIYQYNHQNAQHISNQIIQYMDKAKEYFSRQFLQDFGKVGQDVLQKYAPLVQHYKQIVIPFQTKRLSQNQTLVFENSSLQRDKMDLLQRIQKLKSEGQRMQFSLQTQTQKIHELQRQKDRLQKENQCQLDQITSLRISNKDYQESLHRRDEDIKQVEKDKQQLLEKYEARTADYNILLANYMKDKNMLAQKLNQMNELQQGLLDRQRELTAQKFYFEKQKQSFQEKKAESENPTKNTQAPKRNKIFAQVPKPGNQKKHQQSQKNPNAQILRNPLKKVIKYHQSQIYGMSFNYNGSVLATCGGDRIIKLFDTHNLKPSAVIHSNSVESIYLSVALNYGGQRLLAASTDRTVSMYHGQSGKLLHSFPGHGDKVNSVTWSSSKEKYVSGSEDKQIKVWDIEKASNFLSISCGKTVKVVTSNNVEPVVYSGHGDGSVRVYSINKGTIPVSQIKSLIDFPISSICLLSNRHQILVTSLQGSSLLLLDLKMNKAVGKYQHGDFFNSSAHGSVSPSESLVMAGNCDGSIYYWNRFKGDFVKRISGHDGAVTAISYNYMSNMLASGDKQGSLILWQ